MARPLWLLPVFQGFSLHPSMWLSPSCSRQGSSRTSFCFLFLKIEIIFRCRGRHQPQLHKLMRSDKWIHPIMITQSRHKTFLNPAVPSQSTPPQRQTPSCFPLLWISFVCSRNSYRWNQSLLGLGHHFMTCFLPFLSVFICFLLILYSCFILG